MCYLLVQYSCTALQGSAQSSVPRLGVTVQLNRALGHSSSATASPRAGVGAFRALSSFNGNVKKSDGCYIHSVVQERGGDTGERRGQRADLGTTRAQVVGASASV